MNNFEALYKKPDGIATRWISFENPTGQKGRAAKENRGAKGHACDILPANGSVMLMDYSGSGVVRSIWLTISEYANPAMLRLIRIEMYWDGSSTPAVNAPLGDFFCFAVGKNTPFQNNLFSSPEGRSFNCFIPMPFKTGARILLRNDSAEVNVPELFYCIMLTDGDEFTRDTLYFHAVWRRENSTTLGRDFEILPRVQGSGRYLGTNIQIRSNPDYQGSWFGEGEVKIYLDGDTDYPTLASTGTEDYVGTGWGQGVYCNNTQGCLQAEKDLGRYSFYRFHIIDPVYFDRDCRVTLQQIGCGNKPVMKRLLASRAKIQVVCRIKKDRVTKVMLLEDPNYSYRDFCMEEDDLCLNFLREDDVSAVAYFYLNSPLNDLPHIQPPSERSTGYDDEC
jgi:hypothetical protein